MGLFSETITTILTNGNKYVVNFVTVSYLTLKCLWSWSLRSFGGHTFHFWNKKNIWSPYKKKLISLIRPWRWWASQVVRRYPLDLTNRYKIVRSIHKMKLRWIVVWQYDLRWSQSIKIKYECTNMSILISSKALKSIDSN